MLIKDVRCRYLIGIFVLVILLFNSCSKLITDKVIETPRVVFPSPPAEPRIQYLTKYSTSGDIQKEQSKFSKFVIGAEEKKEIKKPYGVFINNGKIFICDTDQASIIIIDLIENTFDFFKPKGSGQLMFPVNCFVDDDENIYVTDGKRLQVLVYDKLGEFIGAIGEKENFKPTDVFVKNEKIWITNTKNHSILVYDKNTLEHLQTFPNYTEKEDGYLFTPLNLYVTDNEVYVSDFGDFRIKKYSHNGEFINSIGSYGRNIGQFVRPKGIAVDKASNLYVVDAAFENVQIFNDKAKLLMYFGGSYQGPGYMYLPAQISIDYDNTDNFKKYVDDKYELQYLILVSNQYGPDKISVYGYISPK